MEKFKPCGCLTDGRNWLPECKEHENVRRQLRAAQRLNTPNPAPHAAEPMVPTGDYREIHLGAQPADTEPKFVVCSDKGVVQNIQYQGKIYVELQRDGPRVPLAPHVDGRDFYELCQAYRHSKEIAPHPQLPNTVQAFEALKDYIKTGVLPWESYERSDATGTPQE